MKKQLILFTALLATFSFSCRQENRKQVADSRTKYFPKQHVLVEDFPSKDNLWVFLMAGQSNMAGRGLVAPEDTVPDPRILTIDKDMQWILAKEPLHFYEPRLTGLDCGLAFGREMLNQVPDSVTIALIPCAVGGSSVEQWLGDSLFRGVRLYSNFSDKVRFAKKYGTVKGILWHQGENNAKADDLSSYGKKLQELIGKFRYTTGNDTLPFLAAELGVFRAPEYQYLKDSINNIIHRVARADKNVHVVSSDQLTCKSDSIHFNARSQRSLGRRYARIYSGYYVNGRYVHNALAEGKICTIEKQVYIPSPEKNMLTTSSNSYIGRGLRRSELRTNVSSSDWSDTHRIRFSDDNGRTWGPWKLLFKKAPEQNGYVLEGGMNQEGTGPYDPVSGMLIKLVFQRIFKGDPEEALSVIWKGDRRFTDHGFYQLSADNGKTWDEGHMLRYEEGPDFDPDNWGDSVFFHTNEMYIGGMLIHSNGSVIISATVPVPYPDKEDMKVPVTFPNTYREGCVAGAMCFVGRWNPGKKDYDWKTSNKIFLPRKVSTRGLVELNLSELKDGRLLLIMRGSNVGLDPLECPGRKWISISKDGGLTWSDITDFRYDTGEQFYSPATFAKTLRSKTTGKLYCILNISKEPPVGNGPRYPLQIAEIDEDRVALKKSTVTIIDDRYPPLDSATLQLSNFNFLDNRETHVIELYLSRIGERGGGDKIWDSDTYRYFIKFHDEKK